MKSFFKTFLASALGTIVAMGIMSVLTVLIFVGGVAVVMSSGGKSATTVEQNSILSLKLNSPIVDRVTNSPFSVLEEFSGRGKSLGLNDILNGVKLAAEDDNIRGIYLDVTGLQAGLATIEEIRNALLTFKESGKFVVGYADSYGQGAYYLASVADQVYLHPEGDIDWRGLGASVLFFKGTLEKLGIEVQIVRHGKFKGAVEPFLYDKMSPENREQILSYTGNIWRHWLRGIEAQRKIPVNKLQNIANNLLLKDAKSCEGLNFVDGLKYKDQVIADLNHLSLQGQGEFKAVNVSEYANSVKNLNPKAKSTLAILYASGDIVTDGNGTGNAIAGNDMAYEIRQLRKDSSVKAVVFRVNSPGGSSLASDIIWREIDLLRQVKPVVVSMGDYAASGGYYISCPATKIMASPTTITGSIGVFGLWLNVEKAAKDKLGITTDVALTNSYADFANAFRPLSTIERNFLQHSVETVYATFVGHVANGRGMKPEEVDTIGQGRVWSGVEAKSLNLVDEFGGLTESINSAADLAGLMDYKVQEYPKAKNSFELLMETFNQMKVRAFASPAQMLMETAPFSLLRQQHGTVQARITEIIIND